MSFKLPPLPYETYELEPFIDRQTMALHHGKHHAIYVNKLNAVLEPYPRLRSKRIEDLLRSINEVPNEIRAAVRNNGGGHANHSMFWLTMAPPASRGPSGAIEAALQGSFGSVAAFKNQFSNAAVTLFGSGWVWVIDCDDHLTIESTTNQDSPLMEGKTPLFGLDVWEHAYYLRYQNRRAEYVEAWWNVINWTAINEVLARERSAIVGSWS